MEPVNISYDNKTALLKSGLKTVTDPPPPGGLKDVGWLLGHALVAGLKLINLKSL